MQKFSRKFFAEYPGQFWLLVGATFIDRIGGTMLFPFFVLYLTRRFNVGMTQAGVILAVFSLTGMAGSFVGGAMSDRFGCKKLVIAGVLFSGLSSLAMAFAGTFEAFFLLAIAAGFLGDLGGPARMVLVSEILPEKQHSEGFGMMRIAGNLAWIIGPTVGGLIAAHSYFILFLADAVTGAITALIITIKIHEPGKTESREDSHQNGASLLKTIRGYRDVLKDRIFITFLILSILMLTVYQQLYSTYGIFLRDVHGFADNFYGFLLSLNAFMVVLFQIPVTRWTSRHNIYLMMSAGTFLFALSFGLTGIISGAGLFVVIMLVITAGEMIVIPVGQAMVSKLAPADMKGRYMGLYNLSWSIPSLVAPWAAGLVFDYADPSLVWMICGVLAAAAGTGFFILRNQAVSSVDIITDLD